MLGTDIIARIPRFVNALKFAILLFENGERFPCFLGASASTEKNQFDFKILRNYKNVNPSAMKTIAYPMAMIFNC